jgi:hypothetical protein
MAEMQQNYVQGSKRYFCLNRELKKGWREEIGRDI